MKRRLGSAAIIVAWALGVAPLAAQQPPTITREQSKIWLEEIPGLPGPRLVFQYPGWNPAYSVERHFAAAIPPSATYPRLQVNFYVLAPGFVWLRDNPVDEQYVRTWPFFRDRSVTVPAPHKGGGSGVITVRFQADTAHCFAFLIRHLALGTIEGMSGNISLDGFYCAESGQALDDKQIGAVLSSIRVTSDVARPRQAVVRSSGG